MDWRCQFTDMHAIMWATAARRPLPPAPSPKGKGEGWRYGLAMSIYRCQRHYVGNDGAGPLPPTPSDKAISFQPLAVS